MLLVSQNQLVQKKIPRQEREIQLLHKNQSPSFVPPPLIIEAIHGKISINL